MTLLPGMTPTEDLFCEVLGGRFRAGEKMWTFSDRHTRTAKSLEAKGLIFWKSASIEHHILAGLTDVGKAAFLDPAYTGPPPPTKTFGYCAVCDGAIEYHGAMAWVHVNRYPGGITDQHRPEPK